MTPALKNALAQLREIHPQLPTISPAATAGALASIEQMQKALKYSTTKITPAMLNNLKELSAGMASSLGNLNIDEEEARNGEA